MDSRDFLIIGAVVVAAFLYHRSQQPGASVAPTATTGIGGADMTASAAATTAPAGPVVSSQVGPSTPTFPGFSAMNMSGFRFAGSTARAVIADATAPPPPVVPSWYGSPTTVGGAGVGGVGASSMGPQPQLTHIAFPQKLTRY